MLYEIALLSVGNWGCPQPFALLRAGVGLFRASLRYGASHSSRWSLPSYPSATPTASPASAATVTLRRRVAPGLKKGPTPPVGYRPVQRPPTAPARLPLVGRLPTALREGPAFRWSARPSLPKPTTPARTLLAVATDWLYSAPAPLCCAYAAFRQPTLLAAVRQPLPLPIRPASRRVSLGSTPSPRVHAQASARSSSSGSAA